MSTTGYLTPKQYQAAPHNQTWDYNRYKMWVAKQRQKRNAARMQVGPASSFQSQYELLKGLLGKPDPTWKATPEPVLAQRAHDQVMAQIDPVIRELQQTAASRIAAGGQATEAYTKMYADHLAAMVPQVQKTWADAAQGASAIGAGVTGLMQGQGKQVFDELSSKLAAIDAPQAAVTADAGGQKGLAEGAGAQLGAQALTNLLDIKGQGASQVGLAQMQPGFAYGEGAQNLRDFIGGVNSDTSSQLHDLTAKIPGLVSDILTSERQLELDKGQQRDSYQQKLEQIGENILGNRQQYTIAEQGLGADAKKLAADNAQFWANLHQNQDQFTQGENFTAGENSKDRAASAKHDQAQVTAARTQTISSVRHDAASMAASIASTTTKQASVIGHNPDGSPIYSRRSTTATTRTPYRQVYKQVYANYAPDLRAAGVPETRIKQIIAQTLSAAGVSPKSNP